jgi:hypothetical protein
MDFRHLGITIECKHHPGEKVEGFLIEASDELLVCEACRYQRKLELKNIVFFEDLDEKISSVNNELLKNYLSPTNLMREKILQL